jgi:hypothetical protein
LLLVVGLEGGYVSAVAGYRLLGGFGCGLELLVVELELLELHG